MRKLIILVFNSEKESIDSLVNYLDLIGKELPETSLSVEDVVNWQILPYFARYTLLIDLRLIPSWMKILKKNDQK